MSQTISVSVIVPIYQAEPWLQQTLDALARQTLASLEVVMINDGSTDQSGTIARQFCRRNPERFRFIELRHNQGISRVRNLGLAEAKGEYIGFVDADDYVAPEMFESLYQTAKQGQCDWVSCGMNAFENSVDDASPFELPAHYDDTYITNKIFQADFIRQLKLQFYQDVIYEDEAYVYVVRLASERYQQLHQRLYYYRLNPAGACRSPSRTRANLFDKELMLIRLMAELKQRGLLNKGKALMMQCLANHALSALYYRNTKADKRAFVRFIYFLAEKYQLQLSEPLSGLRSDYRVSRFNRFSKNAWMLSLLLLWLPLKSWWQARSAKFDFIQGSRL